MNTSLTNMSDLQKIIFVNNINEDDLANYGTSISALSSEYPFAVFFTEKNGDIRNIWHQGYRYTRFIGVDDLHKTITIGDHTLKLNFDYETGLIGIYDTNVLSSITPIALYWTNFEGTLIEKTYTEDTSDETYIIDSKNNTFDVIFKFTSNDTNTSISQISTALTTYYNGATTQVINLQNKTIENNGLNDDHNIYYRFTYKILEDTFNINNGKYLFKSNYSNDIDTSLNLRLFVNPIKITNINIFNTTENKLFTLLGDNNINQLSQNCVYELAVSINPNNATSQIGKYLYVKLLSNSEHVNIINGIGQINEGYATLKFSIGIIPPNTTIEDLLTFKIFRRLNNIEEAPVESLTKEYSIKVSGISSNKFIYYGFKDPSNIMQSDLTDFNNPGEEIIYDWHDYVNGNKNWNTEEQSLIDANPNRPFYIAIPEEYKNIILPRIDCWTEEENKEDVYVSNINAFTYLSEIEIGNVGTFIIYKSNAFNGFYYGKIQ